MNYKTIGIVAHVDAGKTTFSEQLLFHMNSIKTKGRVDHQDAFLDNHQLERQRGITIFAEQGRFTYGDTTYTLIDTPGHVDFAPEMERAVSVLDCAIIVVSAVEGVQGHTAAVWELLRKQRVPTFIFINKVDREGADVMAVVETMQRELSEHVVYMPTTVDDIKEWLALRDETLLDTYLEGNFTTQQATDILQQLVMKGEAFPCMSGSALNDVGVLPFFEQLHQLTAVTYDTQSSIKARVFKIRHDEQHRLTFVKIEQGTLNVRDDVQFYKTLEKVTEIRVYNGSKFTAVQQAEAGDICALKGISDAQIGMVNGGGSETSPAIFIPTLQANVHYSGNYHVKEVLAIFRMLELEEPTLSVQWHERFQEISVHVSGVIQLEVLTELLRERFQLEVTFGKPRILYKETIVAPVKGYGHFEPLKHYAEVHLLLEPNLRGEGVTTASTCHADDLTPGQQRLIQQHVVERPHNGLLTGFPLTDVHVTLLTGRAHNKHTDGGDFREATIRALRQGLEQADNVLLEPYYRFKMKAPSEYVGRMMTDVQQACGTFEAPEIGETSATLSGRVPVATFLHYSTQFAAYTNGKGALMLQVDGYDVCHNAEEVILDTRYNKDADPEYSSSSIFCAKGKGYTVPWDEAKEAMHCPTN